MQTNSEASNTKSPALTALHAPPAGIWSKFLYYGARYGYLHAICSYVGRRSFTFWRLVGPAITRRYLKLWLATPGPHVLNLGGGGVLSERWLTADVSPRSDVFIDITKPLPMPDNAIDAVFSEEVIEHLDEQHALDMLLECLRILKPGGVLRITTPSLDYFARRAMTDIGALRQINSIFYEHEHRYIYSEIALREALRTAGFIAIRQSTYRDKNAKYGSFDSHADRFSFAPPEWSQYWEAAKPAGAQARTT